MKCVIVSCLLVAVAAELPRFRPARFRFQRQELAPTTTDSAAESTTASAPYPASGWKPDGPEFTLPQKTPENSYGAPQKAPEDSYGAPQKAPEETYGAPQNAPYPAAGWQPAQPFTLPQEQPPATSYGTPDNSYGLPEPRTEDGEMTTENPQAENISKPDVQKSAGTYFIILPTGQLQKVEFMTENDVQNMAYTAKLQLDDRAPIFFFRT